MDSHQAHRIASFYDWRGLSVIPIHCPPWPLPAGSDVSKVGKVPCLRGGPYRYQGAYTTRAPRADVAAWLESGHNLAVVTGPISGVAVLDIDGEDALEWAQGTLPVPAWRVTSARGEHWYYRHPGHPVSTRARVVNVVAGWTLGIDVRGDRGGYVVAPPSVHQSGHVYTLAGDWHTPKANLPPFPSDILRRFSPPPPRSSVAPRGLSPGHWSLERRIARARAYLRSAGPAIQGQGGDDKTFQLTAWIIANPDGPQLPAYEAMDVLKEWNRGCDPPWTEAELWRKVESAGRSSKSAKQRG